MLLICKYFQKSIEHIECPISTVKPDVVFVETSENVSDVMGCKSKTRESHSSVTKALKETAFNWTTKQFYHNRASQIILEEILCVKLHEYLYCAKYAASKINCMFLYLGQD